MFSLAQEPTMEKQYTRQELLEMRREHPDLTNYDAWVACGRPCPASDWPSDDELDAEGVRRVGEWKQATVYGQPVKVRKVDGRTQISFFTRAG